MSEYRPDGWEETKMLEFTTYYENEPFEAGASAMLKMLREEGVKLRNRSGKQIGCEVFIPDDKE